MNEGSLFFELWSTCYNFQTEISLDPRFCGTIHLCIICKVNIGCLSCHAAATGQTKRVSPHVTWYRGLAWYANYIPYWIQQTGRLRQQENVVCHWVLWVHWFSNIYLSIVIFLFSSTYHNIYAFWCPVQQIKMCLVCFQLPWPNCPLATKCLLIQITVSYHWGGENLYPCASYGILSLLPHIYQPFYVEVIIKNIKLYCHVYDLSTLRWYW